MALMAFITLPICEFLLNFMIDHWFMCIIIGIYIFWDTYIRV